MALNKFMHPRNIYKTPPDFAKLALNYEEFSNIVKKDITGKISIDFKDPNSLRILTKYLLKSDFNLDVTIPADRLVPTLPLRLNYILWIEDLLDMCQLYDNVRGLDIGTGACAIYPLLAAVKNKWLMVGTETDEQSFEAAKDNVQRNNLQKLIHLVKSPTTSVLQHVLDNEDVQQFEFSMCNPPFYANIQELCESRSPARLPPKNGFTGSVQELITEGGELEFCRKIIKESKCYKHKILVFTTMVGHKHNLRELIQDLKSEGIRHTSTEFCQGRITRWGLAWTYQDSIINLVPRENPRKKNVPITYSLPELKNIAHNVENISIKIKSLLKDLHIEYRVLNKRGNCLCLDILAPTNTWSNQRRKRRLLKRLETDHKRLKLDTKQNNGSIECMDAFKVPKTKSSDSTEPEAGVTQNIENNKFIENKSDAKVTENTETNKLIETNAPFSIDTSLADSSFKRILSEKVRDKTMKCINKVECNIVGEINSQDPLLIPIDKSTSQITGHASGSSCTQAQTSVKIEPVVHAFFKIVKKQADVILEMEFLDGSAGKEGLHQIIQYIKNNWK